MKQTDPQYKLRWPEELRDSIEGLAKSSGRTINAEICYRLDKSLRGAPDLDDIRFLISKFKADTADLEVDKSLLQMHLREVGLALLVVAMTMREDREKLSDNDLDEMIAAGKDAVDAGQIGTETVWQNLDRLKERVEKLEGLAKKRGVTLPSVMLVEKHENLKRPRAKASK